MSKSSFFFYCFQICSLCGSSLWPDHVAASDAYGLLADVPEFITQQLSGTANVLDSSDTS